MAFPETPETASPSGRKSGTSPSLDARPETASPSGRKSGTSPSLDDRPETASPAEAPPSGRKSGFCAPGTSPSVGDRVQVPLKACPLCRLIQTVPVSRNDEETVCARCGTAFPEAENLELRISRTGALAMTALILFPAAISLPLLRIERFGHFHETGLFGGCSQLAEDGHLFLAALIFLCSMVFPLLKLCGILFVSTFPQTLNDPTKVITVRLIEFLGRWGMLDVLVVALLAAAVKLSDVVEITPGEGTLLFALTVLFSLAASTCFDPTRLWEARTGE